MKLLFGDIVVVEGDQIGVVVKNWVRYRGNEKPVALVEVYVRNYRGIKEYENSEVERYQVRHKELDEQEIEYQSNCEHEL